MNHQLVHTQDFINKWKIVLKKLYNYEEYMDFMVVPSISFNKSLSYLPLLNYTDRTSDNIDDLLELSKDNDFQIRVLNFGYYDFKENDTVTMRLDISSGNENYVFNNIIKSKCRNQIRKSQKSDIVFKIGQMELLNDFYNLFKNTMHIYGTPVFKEELFRHILDNMDSRICVVYRDNMPIAALLLLFDDDIAIVPWAASSSQFMQYCPNHLLYYEAIKYSINRNKKIFDFGRSGYLVSNTYKFKEKWGAIPIKIDIIKNKYDNVYSKYSFASMVWKKLPTKVVNYVGPKLCKYLVDL